MKFSQHIIAGFLLIVIIATSIGAYPKNAEAGSPMVYDPFNFIQNTLSAIVDVDIQLKEFVLDGLAKSVANAVATELKNSIVTWINSGFEGNPAFITDFEGFLLDAGDTVAADFIQSLDSKTQSLICSPWRNDIKYSLTISYYSSTAKGPNRIKNRCSLDEIFKNVERLDKFLDGGFSNGGWEGWFNVTTKPHNNPYGSYLQVEDELSGRLLGKKISDKDQLGWSSGVLSKKVCDDEASVYLRDSGLGTADYTTITEGEDAGCIVVTPGHQINTALNDVLGSDLDDLELADEFNEIISALFAQLAKEVITGASGLLGTSRPQGSNRQSFLDRVGVNQNQQTQKATSATVNERLTQSVGNESSFKDRKTESLGRVTSVDTALKSLEACLATKSPSDPAFTASFAFATKTRSTINSTIPLLTASITSSDSALVTLAQLQADAKATTNTQTLQGILTTLQNLEAANTVHNGADVIAATRELADISKNTTAATTEAETRLSSCML